MTTREEAIMVLRSEMSEWDIMSADRIVDALAGYCRSTDVDSDLSDARDQAEIAEKQLAEVVTERDAMRATIAELHGELASALAAAGGSPSVTPVPYEGNLYAVYKTDMPDAERPLAVFGYGDWAEKWARETYGTFDGFRLIMHPCVTVRAIPVRR